MCLIRVYFTVSTLGHIILSPPVVVAVISDGLIEGEVVVSESVKAKLKASELVSTLVKVKAIFNVNIFMKCLF